MNQRKQIKLKEKPEIKPHCGGVLYSSKYVYIFVRK